MKRRLKDINSRNDASSFKGNGATGPLKEGAVMKGLDDKARRDLRFGSVSVKADPYDSYNSVSDYYPIVASFNKIIGPSYNGRANLDGGNVQQYGYSNTSKFLEAWDYIYMRLNANYNNVPVRSSDAAGDHYPGKALIDEMRKAIAEGGSILGATTFTQLAFNSYAVETDLPMGSANPTTIDGIEMYTDFTDVFYAWSTFYQLVFQSARMCTAVYNSFRAKFSLMLRTGFNREVPQLNSLFGLFRKSSFVAILQSVNKSFEGEYFDTKFARTMDLITMTPSRRSNSYFDPVLELGLGLSHPSKFKLHVLNTKKDATVGDPIDLMDLVTIDFSDVINTEQPIKTIFDIQESLFDTLSAEDTVKWARSTIYNSTFANDRFNAVKYLYDGVNTILTRFKIRVSDLREALDVLARAGIVKWSKGFIPAVTTIEDIEMTDNRFVSDIFKSAMSGARDIYFNPITKRWRTFTLWSMYNGIPEYDINSGGSFLTFSFKNFINEGGTEDRDSTIDYTPRVFSGTRDGNFSVRLYATNRSGTELKIDQGDAVRLNDSIVLNRLVPLSSQSDLVLRLPYADMRGNYTNAEKSLAYKMLCQVFGLAGITFATGQLETALDPDILAVYQIELDDITNEALTMARDNCVLKGTNQGESIIGFH